MVETRSRNIAHHDPVHGRRDQTYLDFGKARVQNLRVLPAAHLLVP